MDSKVTTSDLLRLVAERAGVGMWQQRWSVLAAALVATATLGYVMVANPSATSTTMAASTPTSSTGDCANTVMAAVEQSSGVTIQEAYQCMTPSVQEAMTQTTFAQKLASIRVPNATRITRLGSYQSSTGGTLVYFAVDANMQSVGYVVYVGRDGKVEQVQ